MFRRRSRSQRHRARIRESHVSVSPRVGSQPFPDPSAPSRAATAWVPSRSFFVFVFVVPAFRSSQRRITGWRPIAVTFPAAPVSVCYPNPSTRPLCSVGEPGSSAMCARACRMLPTTQPCIGSGASGAITTPIPWEGGRRQLRVRVTLSCHRAPSNGRDARALSTAEPIDRTVHLAPRLTCK